MYVYCMRVRHSTEICPSTIIFFYSLDYFILSTRLERQLVGSVRSDEYV